jgi:hypothetical protein
MSKQIREQKKKKKKVEAKVQNWTIEANERCSSSFLSTQNCTPGRPGTFIFKTPLVLSDQKLRLLIDISPNLCNIVVKGLKFNTLFAWKKLKVISIPNRHTQHTHTHIFRHFFLHFGGLHNFPSANVIRCHDSIVLLLKQPRKWVYVKQVRQIMKIRKGIYHMFL